MESGLKHALADCMESSMMRRSVGILGILALLVLAWFWWRADEPSEAEEAGSASPTRVEEASAAEVLREALPPGVDVSVAPAQARHSGLLVSAWNGERLEEQGVATIHLAWDDRAATTREYEVHAGAFVIEKDVAAAFEARSFSRWSLAFSGASVARSAALEFRQTPTDDGSEIQFVFAERRGISVRVTDLKGDPIAGARVECDSRTGWPQWGSSQIVTNDHGVAEFAIYPQPGNLLLRAACPGYGTHSTTLDPGMSECSVSLRRILAVCVIHSDRVVLAESAVFHGIGGYQYALRDSDFGPLVAEIESKTPIEDFERYSWEILCETQWLDSASISVTYSEWFGGQLGTAQYAFQHLIDPNFVIERVPAEILQQPERLYEVHFAFQDARQFLADPPERIQLRVRSQNPAHRLNIPFEPESDAGFPVSPRRLSGLIYRAYLPEGSFTIADSGYDWIPRRPHRDPRLREATSFLVSPSEAPFLVPVALHADEAFVRQRFVDAFGRPLDLEAVLLPEDPELPEIMVGFMATAGRESLERFVRPGNFTVWIYDSTKLGSVRYPDRIEWSGVVSPEGYWDVLIDVARLETALKPR